ncbi:MAG: four-carbon acid sugar kinase family protein [Nitratireductor sp.]|nr:four-carbon acid sugar kinase family protein [Nitratireductor sp.]
MLLGCIGDDATGASDLANILTRGGMRVVQYNGTPSAPAGGDVEAGVVALKTRTAEAADALAQSLAALAWLREQGCRQFLFKYCSTFDSTPSGNIGPVLDALCGALGTDRAVVCPAFPATGRSVYQGHLFVGDRLLNQSGMENHPLTPMTDPDLRRWLALQTDYRVGHVPFALVDAGAEAIGRALDDARARGERYIVTDAIRDCDLVAIGHACADEVLISGGSGIGLGLPQNFRLRGLLGDAETKWRGETGPAAAICGSCSVASRGQIKEHARHFPARAVSADDILAGTVQPSDVADWMLANQQSGGPPLAYSSADPDGIASAQKKYGKARVAEAIEGFFSALARLVVPRGVTRLILAGGETSGAVVAALSLPAFEIGPEIDPGVPALRAVGSPLTLALKSGNFGAPDFFVKAAAVLAGDEPQWGA